jgi:membrane-associated phospholipid phosphatase
LSGVVRRRPDPPLLSPSLRRQAAAVVVVAAGVFAVLAVRYAGGSSARWFDDRSESVVEDFTPRTRGVVVLIEVGSPPVVVATAALTALACLWFGRRRLALLAVLGPGLAGAVATLSQPLVGRTVEGDWAYPSGHTTGATSLALVAAFVLVALLRPDPPWAATLIAGIGVLAGAAMTVLVVAGGWHYATDAVGGFLVAVASVLSCALLIDALLDRRERATATAP